MMLYLGKPSSGRKERVRRNKIVAHTVYSIEQVMKEAVDQIIDRGFESGQFLQPSLNRINVITDAFYGEVIRAAFYQCEEDKRKMEGKPKPKNKVRQVKHLAGRGPKGIPKNLESLEEIFRDKKYFRALMRRSRALSERMKKNYLAKLKKKFKEIMPKVLEGEIDVRSAKKEMLKTWEASRSRVDTIFQTETTNYFSEVQVKFFEQDDKIIGFLFESRETSTTTDICHSRDGMVFTKEMTGKHSIAYNTPALHYNCHSKLIPLANTAENRKLLEDSSRDPTKHNLVPLPDGWR